MVSHVIKVTCVHVLIAYINMWTLSYVYFPLLKISCSCLQIFVAYAQGKMCVVLINVSSDSKIKKEIRFFLQTIQ